MHISEDIKILADRGMQKIYESTTQKDKKEAIEQKKERKSGTYLLKI